MLFDLLSMHVLARAFIFEENLLDGKEKDNIRIEQRIYGIILLGISLRRGNCVSREEIDFDGESWIEVDNIR